MQFSNSIYISRFVSVNYNDEYIIFYNYFSGKTKATINKFVNKRSDSVQLRFMNGEIKVDN